MKPKKIVQSEIEPSKEDLWLDRNNNLKVFSTEGWKTISGNDTPPTPIIPSADAVSYDNSKSGFSADNVQDAIDEVGANLGEYGSKVDSLMDRADLVSVQAQNVGYQGNVEGTTNAKGAIDKLGAEIDMTGTKNTVIINNIGGLRFNNSNKSIFTDTNFSISFSLVKKDEVCNIAIDAPNGWSVGFCEQLPSIGVTLTNVFDRGGAAKTASYTAPYDGYLCIAYVASNLVSLSITIDRNTIGKDVRNLKTLTNELNSKVSDVTSAVSVLNAKVDKLESVIYNSIDEISNDVTNGTNKLFHFSDYINQESDLLVYVDGIKKFITADYVVSKSGRYILFNIAPNQGSVVGFHYSNRQVKSSISIPFTSDTLESDGKTFNGIAFDYLEAEFETYGNGTHQYMSIENDPKNSSNKVLALISKSNESNKIRCQCNMKNLKANSLTTSVDVYLPSNSIGCLSSYVGAIDWFTLQEIWAPWAGVIDTIPSFRGTLGIAKNSGESSLYFYFKTENVSFEGGVANFQTISEYDDRVSKIFSIPFDKWITLKTTVKYGADGYGKFKLEASVEGNNIVVMDLNTSILCTLLDQEEFRYTDKGYLSASTSLMKMYTSNTINNYIVNNSESNQMKILFKNFSFDKLEG